jgi:hypothetical protein
MLGVALQKPARLATIYDTSATVGLSSSRHSINRILKRKPPSPVRGKCRLGLLQRRREAV